jgi:hypothetical protein
MGFGIVVGGIPDGSWARPVAEFVGGAGRQNVLQIVKPWFSEETVADVDTFNLASLVLFTDYTADLEGLANRDGTGQGSRWKNLPYWLHAVWLPLNGETIEPVVWKDNAGWEVMISTATGLINDLQQISELSNMELGVKPGQFDLMLSDPPAFYKSTADITFSDKATLQWMWYAYFWAAQKSLQSSTPVWQAG